MASQRRREMMSRTEESLVGAPTVFQDGKFTMVILNAEHCGAKLTTYAFSACCPKDKKEGRMSPEQGRSVAYGRALKRMAKLLEEKNP
jgi:hypothetical protein